MSIPGLLDQGAVPIIVAVSARSWHGRPVDGFVVRKEIKDHGTERRLTTFGGVRSFGGSIFWPDCFFLGNSFSASS
jgi:hypothetical protein